MSTGLVFCSNILAHGNGRNEGTQPRLAQYVTMYPAREAEAERQSRVACFEEQRAPDGWEREIPELYFGRESQYPVAELTPLGRRLLGADVWE